MAHHSWALLTAPQHGVHDLTERFPHEQSLVVDALVYADMHAAPHGGVISADRRLADIAYRHQYPIQVARADLLRGSIHRVQDALGRAPAGRDVPNADGELPAACAGEDPGSVAPQTR